MTDQPAPGDKPHRPALTFLKRDLPERAKASKWCGKHDKARTELVVRREWVCLDCVREKALGT